MGFADMVKAVLELGVIPTLALFLVAAMHQQNRTLMRDRQEMERRLLEIVADIIVKAQAPVRRGKE